MITQERLKELLDISDDTNSFIWKLDFKKRKKGDVVIIKGGGLFIEGKTYSLYKLRNLFLYNTYILDTIPILSNIITYEELISILNYDADIGIFTWKNPRSFKNKVGDIAGYKHRTGYYYIELGGKPYASHRLAWFYTFKKWPDNDIDHIDRDPSNNRLVNLRDATESENMRNRSIGKNNTSGFIGVSYYKKSDKWKASFVLDGKPKHIGYYSTPEEASIAYEKFKASN